MIFYDKGSGFIPGCQHNVVFFSYIRGCNKDGRNVLKFTEFELTLVDPKSGITG
jgi:hypothetical protein